MSKENNTYQLLTYEHEVIIERPSIISYEWCCQNIQGKYSAIMHYWSFELKDDAILFKLTWG